MKSFAPPLALTAFALCACALGLRADDHVAIVASADDNYTQRKFGDGKPLRESYVYMQGHFYSGPRVDHSLDRMTFRELVSYLTPRLAEHQFVAAKTVRDADLLLLVHWGVTNPRTSFAEMTSRATWEPGTAANEELLRQHENAATNAEAEATGNSPSSDFEQRPAGALPGLDQTFFENLEFVGDTLSRDSSQRDNAQLLGYADALRKFSRTPRLTAEEQTLRFDLSNERYFVIIRAFDLRDSLQTKKPKLVWTVHMNISSPGNNFRSAMGRMSYVGPQFFGTTTDNVKTVRPNIDPRDAKVELGELVILGETK